MSQYIPIDHLENASPVSRPLSQRIKWGNLSFTILLIALIVVFFVVFLIIDNSYEIEYVEYEMKYNDSLFNVVQDMNSYVPWGWDARDFVYLAVDKNNISDASSIKHGEKLLIPIAKPKE